MKKVAVIDEKLCDRSPFCPVKRVCPQKAVVAQKGSAVMGIFASIAKYEIDNGKCTGCGLCVDYCPMKAVKII